MSRTCDTRAMYAENSGVKAYELKNGSLLYQQPRGRDPDLKVLHVVNCLKSGLGSKSIHVNLLLTFVLRPLLLSRY
jgi:hypothetical protein